jgi:hypothetical protein
VLNWLTPIVTSFGLLTGYILSLVGAGPALAALFAVGGPLAALAGLYGLVRPQGLNEGEDELARQRRYGPAGAGAGAGSGGGAGAAPSGGGIIPGAHAAESNRRPKPGEFGTPWNHQTGGAPVRGGGASGRYGPQLPGGGKRTLMRHGGAASGGGGGKPNANFTKENADAIRESAARLGTSPEDLATVIGYESAGTYNPSKWGGLGGNYMGLIQFGPSERKQYGAYEGQPFREQMGAVERYLTDRGFKPGMGLLDLYSTINAGRPGLYDRRDINGSVREHVARMAVGATAARARKFLASGGENNTPAPSATNAYVVPGANRGDASQALGTAPGAGVPSSSHGQKFTDYYAKLAGSPKLKSNMSPAEINAWNAAHGGAAAGNAWQKALHTLSRPHEHAKRLLQHISANVPNVGAATASHVANHHHGPVNSHNTASHEVHVGAVNVHTAATDASGIVRDIKPALERASFSSLGNYSLA